ncbi:hypothetical protein IQ266_03680 [filamentous cyanobacterium LEGE 11480]|uniref:DUF7925 domain-containing protein n=1 Tax=Romeriopsis navalis LEGE 11480 TaxID=2777977 RepID=A0A928Z119_9CYAN|nr:hypothetical protein [Romeriopsis navalis]MBE9028861.1 hypothetical protein [Romeriopsis navalis LEGE 11480]
MNNKTRLPYRQVLAVMLAASGLVSLALPVLADGTVAGTSISNTANATYEDPNAPGTTIDATSNTVTVKVAEVAGITVTASGVTDVNGGQVQVGDALQYVYTVTNVGNDPTTFRVPNLATVTGPASVSGNLEISTDGGTTWTAITGADQLTPSIEAGGSVLVRVPVTVAAGAQANDLINVTLGDTPGDSQNQLRNPNGGDVYTVDNADGTGGNEVDGAPVNGTREAGMTQQVTVASTLKTYALATVLKSRSDYSDAGTPQITDDTLTYDLSIRVEGTDPTGNGITPAPLVGQSITVDTVASSRILVSDAIPKDTELAVAPTAPPGWEVVYTIDPVTTDANAAQWTTTAPTNLNTVTRIGFVNNPAVVTSVAPGSTVSGFAIQVKVAAGAVAPLTVNNMAQLFGQTPGTNVPVYDESGDQNPSNYDGTTPPTGTDTNNDGVPDTTPTVNDGYIDDPTDATATGTDPGNNNNGTGPDGEANVFVISEPTASAVQNGPENAPDAVGPTSVDDDFTNKSSLVPPDTAPGSTLDPAPVAFTNTVKNAGTDAGELKLEPKAPADPTDLPDGTTVTVTYGADSVSYEYNGGNFAIVSSTTGGTPITIPNFDPNDTINYGVEVNLPADTPLSTDAADTEPEKGFPVPIVASIDNYTTDANNDGVKDGGNDGAVDATNETIDRVYTGFLKMLKESRILPGSGPAPATADTTFSTDEKNPSPGNIIEYRISYTNISEAQAGTGNVLLNASNVQIVEDGTLSTVLGDGKNNWALDNDSDGKLDTSNIVGSASDSGASTITFFNGKPATSAGADQTGTTFSTDVTKYVNTITGLVAPAEQRTFTFQRKMN